MKRGPRHAFSPHDVAPHHAVAPPRRWSGGPAERPAFVRSTASTRMTMERRSHGDRPPCQGSDLRRRKAWRRSRMADVAALHEQVPVPRPEERGRKVLHAELLGDDAVDAAGGLAGLRAERRARTVRVTRVGDDDRQPITAAPHLHLLPRRHRLPAGARHGFRDRTGRVFFEPPHVAIHTRSEGAKGTLLGAAFGGGNRMRSRPERPTARVRDEWWSGPRSGD
ncbi:MAG: hypothetical protein RL199_313 [Pseudomonadota bacterium]|jgi:hypothetical protein